MPEKRFVRDRQHQEDLISGKALWPGPKPKPVITPPSQIQQIKETTKGINVPDINKVQVDTEKRDSEMDAYKRQQRSNKWNSFKSDVSGTFGKIGNALGSDKAKGIYSGIGAVTDLASTFIKPDEDSSFESQQAIGDSLLKFNPGLGAAYKGLSVLETAVGAQTNTLNDAQASTAEITRWQKFANNLASKVPFLGALMGAQKTTDALGMTQETQNLNNAFADSVSDINIANTLGGKRYLRGAANQSNNLIDEANRNNILLTEMGIESNKRTSSVASTASDRSQQLRNQFAANTYARVGKNGMKLMSVDECRRILEARKESEVQSFHNGGIIGIDVNVIGEGKYHAHKNHLNEVSEEFEDLTKKGIPVVTLEEGGELAQLAEIEKKEIIFRLEVTTKLEELYEDGSDEAAIEAGKLLAIEICENTQDNSGEVLGNGEAED